MPDVEHCPDWPEDALAAFRHHPMPDADEAVAEVPTATHWPEVPAGEAAMRWAELRSWVDHLLERFACLDHHVIPRCWWRHNEHVEALSALRDHELGTFFGDAPATAPLDWLRALRDVVQLLRTWTAETGCSAQHRPPSTISHAVEDPSEWHEFVAADVQRRALDQGATGPARAT